MFQFKPLSPEGVEPALERAEQYRLLNEPREAESICRDILAIDPDNRRAIIQLVLALSEQLAEGGGEYGLAVDLDDLIADETRHRDEIQLILNRWD